jgi:hypothetical protein
VIRRFMDVSIEKLLQVIGEEHVKVVLLEEQVKQLKRQLDKNSKEPK